MSGTFCEGLDGSLGGILEDELVEGEVSHRLYHWTNFRGQGHILIGSPARRGTTRIASA